MNTTTLQRRRKLTEKEKLPFIKQYASVRLKDGRRGAVIEVYGDQELFDVDVGSSPADWETLYDLTREDIVEILWEPKDDDASDPGHSEG